MISTINSKSLYSCVCVCMCFTVGLINRIVIDKFPFIPFILRHIGLTKKCAAPVHVFFYFAIKKMLAAL